MCSLLDWGAALEAATCLLMQGTKYVRIAKILVLDLVIKVLNGHIEQVDEAVIHE